MNLVTRIFAMLCALALAAGALAVIALVTGSMSPERLQFIDVGRAWLDYLPRMGLQAVLTVVLGSAFVLIVSIIIFLAQFPRRERDVLFLVSEDDGGAIHVSRDAVLALVKHVGSTVSGVEEVRCKCRQRDGQEVALSCRVSMRPVVDMVEAGQKFKDTVRGDLEGKTGLKLGTINLVTKYSSGKPAREEQRRVI